MPNLENYRELLQCLFSSLASQGSLPNSPIGFSSGHGLSLVHGRRSDLGRAKKHQDKLFIKNGPGSSGTRVRFVRFEEEEVGNGAGRTEERGMGRRRRREALNVSKGGAFYAGEEAMGRGRGGRRQRMIKKFEARGAEGRRVEAEDARGAEAAIDAAKLNAVEKRTVSEATVGAFGIKRFRGRRGFRRWEIHRVRGREKSRNK